MWVLRHTMGINTPYGSLVLGILCPAMISLLWLTACVRLHKHTIMNAWHRSWFWPVCFESHYNARVNMQASPQGWIPPLQRVSAQTFKSAACVPLLSFDCLFRAKHCFYLFTWLNRHCCFVIVLRVALTAWSVSLKFKNLWPEQFGYFLKKNREQAVTYICPQGFISFF